MRLQQLRLDQPTLVDLLLQQLLLERPMLAALLREMVATTW